MDERICPSCGAAVPAGARFCPHCGTAIRGSSSDAAPPSAAPRSIDAEQLTSLGRIAKVAALLCFLLPWATVSCAGRQLASVSGARLAIGRHGIHHAMPGLTIAHPASVQLPVALAALLIVGALALSYGVSRKNGARAGVAGSIAAAILIAYEVLLLVPERFAQAQANRSTDLLTNGVDASAPGLITFDPQFGFWLTLIVLAVSAVLDSMLWQRIAGEVP